MDTRQLLLEFSALDGVAGRENAAISWAAEKLGVFGAVSITPLGSVLCTVRKPVPGGAHMLLDAHLDEIGMIVTTIDADTGFLRVSQCGGIDRRLLAAAPVTVHAKRGPLPGVVCSVPPHLAGDGEKKNQKVDEIYIDTGFSAEDARDKISPGDIVTIRSASRALLNDLVSGKAIDDRAGCVAHLKALECLGDTPLSCGLTVLFSSMEEVGGQGAKTAAYLAAPTHAIAVDVSFAYTPDAKKEKTGELKKGPMVGYAPILSHEMSRDFARVAAEKGIPSQHEVMGGRTGTNADQLATTRGGVITGLLSIPQKYMHTPIETVAISDVEDTGRLIAAYITEKWGSR